MEKLGTKSNVKMKTVDRKKKKKTKLFFSPKLVPNLVHT